MLKFPRRIDGWFVWFWSHVKTSENAYWTCHKCFYMGIKTLPTEHLEWFHRLYVVKKTWWEQKLSLSTVWYETWYSRYKSLLPGVFLILSFLEIFVSWGNVTLHEFLVSLVPLPISWKHRNNSLKIVLKYSILFFFFFFFFFF